MTHQSAPILEEDLHAYVDGLLPETRSAEVESFLAANPKEADRVRAYQKQKEALRALFDSILDDPIPPRLLHPKRLWSWPVLRYAAIVAWITLGGALGWLVRGADSRKADESSGFARQAATAHAVYSPEVRHPVEVGRDQEEHLVTWLSKRLGAPLKPPHLSQLGFEMVGGRLLPGTRGPVAQFMYQDEKGQRLTLYVRMDPATKGETAFRYTQEGKVGVFYWLDGPFGYALSGEMKKEELLKVANAIYHQLNP